MMRIVLFVMMMVFVLPLAAEAQMSRRDAGVVPLPAQLSLDRGSYRFTRHTRILADGGEEIERIGEHFALLLRLGAGLSVPVERYEGPGLPAGAILLSTRNAEPTLGHEGYELTIMPGSIIVRAPQPVGVFYGVQTLRQLLPAAIESAQANEARPLDWVVPSLRVRDQPRYRWRGLMLDTAGCYMEPRLIKRTIDLLAYHKMNVLHWRLSDDKVWRLRMDRYATLTDTSARLEDAEAECGGYYTQDEVREIIAYARDRYLTIVPGVELLGHCEPILEAFPQLRCAGLNLDAATDSSERADVCCIGSEEFLDTVEGILAEIIALFPSEYIHVGGAGIHASSLGTCTRCQERIVAEGLADERELLAHCFRHLGDSLEEHGRRMIGWGGDFAELAPSGAILESRRDIEETLSALRSSREVVVSPASRYSLELGQFDDPDRRMQQIIITLEDVYGFEPTPPGSTRDQASLILGPQAILRTAGMERRYIDRMLFPRLAAFAETAWTPRARRDWKSFEARLQRHLDRLDALGVEYYIPPPVCLTKARSFEEYLDVELSGLRGPGEIRFTIDGKDPREAGWPYVHPVRLTESTTLRAVVILPGGRSSDVVEWRFDQSGGAR